METRQLSTRRPGRHLRWTRGPRHSIRAYALAPQADSSSCVSTRSSELNVVLDGDMVLEVGPARQSVRVRAGEAALVARGVPHRVRVERPTRFVVVDVDAPAAPALSHLPAAKAPAALLGEVDRSWGQRPGQALRTLDEAARQLVTRMGVGELTDIEIASSTRRMEIVKRVLEARFADPPSLGELAQARRAQLGRGLRRLFVVRAKNPRSLRRRALCAAGRRRTADWPGRLALRYSVSRYFTSARRSSALRSLPRPMPGEREMRSSSVA